MLRFTVSTNRRNKVISGKDGYIKGLKSYNLIKSNQSLSGYSYTTNSSLS